ncbi:Intersectin-1 [Eufriesea mexicana]|uniref:Intersectin-1 n=1 Tax=Eufriesea mexicana TaxID=516756 RepID=A0A310SAN8_9HYME|nr:Intersectin-1 [Eufriesea mexicana]
MEAIVEYNYEAQEPDELTLKKGDIITEIKVMLGGWWEEPLSSGTVGSTGSGGSEGASSAKSEDVSLKNGGSKRRFCKVLFNYEPCNKDELTLVPQDSIEFLGEVEEGWWRGRLKGRVGVFPSNFVSPPACEEPDKHKDQDSKKMCKVLFPYEAANVDELTLNEGDIITLLSTNASDKGWWIGELNGQVGLFPDNFVEILNILPDHQDHEQKLKASIKSVTKHSHQVKKNGKVHTRKSLDVKDAHADATKKAISTATPSTTMTSPGVGGSGGERKTIGHSITSNLKRLVGDVGTNNGNGNTNTALGEELDGVERGEGAPLSHLTASRAKAPHRRPPSSQRLRRHAAGSTSTTTTTTPEDSLANGNADTMLEQLREEEPEGLAAKARRKAPWVEELKLNQLERRKIVSLDRVDKSEEKKERPNSRALATTTNVADCINKLETESEESKQKDKGQSQKSDTSPYLEPISTTSGTPIYVPFALYNQLLERVVALEEKQAMLQHTMGQILEQFVPLPSSINIPD